MREPAVGRYVQLRPRRLRPECPDRVEALADKHDIDRDLARRAATRTPDRQGLRDRAELARGKLVLVEPPKR